MCHAKYKRDIFQTMQYFFVTPLKKQKCDQEKMSHLFIYFYSLLVVSFSFFFHPILAMSVGIGSIAHNPPYVH